MTPSNNNINIIDTLLLTCDLQEFRKGLVLSESKMPEGKTKIDTAADLVFSGIKELGLEGLNLEQEKGYSLKDLVDRCKVIFTSPSADTTSDEEDEKKFKILNKNYEFLIKLIENPNQNLPEGSEVKVDSQGFVDVPLNDSTEVSGNAAGKPEVKSKT